MPRKKIVQMDSARKEGKPMAANEREFTKLNLKDKKGNVYTLEFNSRVVKNMERNGFVVDTDHPYTMIESLFTGAFQMHHKGMQRDRIMEIWDEQTKKDDLLGVLIKLYMMPLEDLMEEKDEDADPTWETV